MSYDYERYDGKRYIVDGEIIGLLAMEFGHEVEQVYEEYRAQPALSRSEEMFRAGLSYQDIAEQLEAENAKLQKLARDVYSLHWHGLDCTECPWFDECDTNDGCPWLYIMHNHMRKLGVEVDG